MDLTEAEQAALLDALSPPGSALPSDRDSNWQRLLAAFAASVRRAHLAVLSLRAELDPRAASVLLADWERLVGLPDTCDPGQGSIEERRAAVVTRLTNQGGQSHAYFIQLAERLGFPSAEIVEYTPHTVDASVDHPLYDDDWAHAWKLRAPTPDVNQINVDSNVDESLGDISPTSRLECYINRLKPAHTVALFEYT